MGIAPILAIGAAALGANEQRRAAKKSRQQQEAAMRQAQTRIAPYEQTGQQANDLIQQGLSTGTLGGSFTPTNLAEDAGYQFRLAEAKKALKRQQAATGNLYSGQAILDAQRQAQGLASQEYQDAFNRWLQEQQNRYNILSGQQDVGFRGAGGISNLDFGIGQNRAQATQAMSQARQRGFGETLGTLSNVFDPNNYLNQSSMQAAFAGY